MKLLNCIGTIGSRPTYSSGCVSCGQRKLCLKIDNLISIGNLGYEYREEIIKIFSKYDDINSAMFAADIIEKNLIDSINKNML